MLSHLDGGRVWSMEWRGGMAILLGGRASCGFVPMSVANDAGLCVGMVLRLMYMCQVLWNIVDVAEGILGSLRCGVFAGRSRMSLRVLIAVCRGVLIQFCPPLAV
jgi:hypothetical protein